MHENVNTSDETILVNKNHYINLLANVLGLIPSDEDRTPNHLLKILLNQLANKKDHLTIQEKLFEMQLIKDFITLQITSSGPKAVAKINLHK